MVWNWQLNTWPHFTYNPRLLTVRESSFTYHSGLFIGAYIHINEQDKKNITVDLICNEALKTSEIEGEHLKRDSVQASIGRHFGLVDHRKSEPAEHGISEMMIDLYDSFAAPLSHEALKRWHAMLMNGRRDLENIGEYRTHIEPMLIISGPIGNTTVHFEAPPSHHIFQEMDQFINWFNASAPSGPHPLSALTRAGIAHWYFENIHPFEDGNGRIGRAIAEKSLAQSLGQPTLIALSHTLQKHRKEYYNALRTSNHSTEISVWLDFFSNMVIEAQVYTQRTVQFFIEKTKLYDKMKNQLNPRQEKVIARIFKEGIEGFKGGLNAENYISITQTSRATATRDLQELVEKAVLTRLGELKGTRYYLNIRSIMHGKDFFS